MKKKVALLLAAIMMMAMPASAYAITDAEKTNISNDIMTLNNGMNGVLITISGGVAVSAIKFNAVTHIDENGNLLSEDGTAVPVDPSEPAPAVPYFTVASSGITSGVINPDYETTSIPLTLTPPYNPATRTGELPLNGCYAVSILDEAGNVIWLAYGFTNPEIAAGDSNLANIKTGVNKSGSSSTYAGFADVTGTKNYTITAYALSSAPTKAGTPLQTGFTLADFNAGIEGKVLGGQIISASYTK